jgi:hypothetical protein
MELHLVDPVAVAVERPELRRVRVGQPTVLAGLRPAGQDAEAGQGCQGLRARMPAYRLAERAVVGDHVVVDQRGCLVRGSP